MCQALQPKHAHELQPSDFDLAAELAVALAPTVIPLQLETGSLVIERHHLPRLVSVCVPWQPKGAELSRDDALALMPAQVFFSEKKTKFRSNSPCNLIVQPVIEKWLADWTADMFPDRTFNTGRAIELSDARYRIAVTGHRSFDHRPAESFLEREFEYALTLVRIICGFFLELSLSSSFLFFLRLGHSRERCAKCCRFERNGSGYRSPLCRGQPNTYLVFPMLQYNVCRRIFFSDVSAFGRCCLGCVGPS